MSFRRSVTFALIFATSATLPLRAADAPAKPFLHPLFASDMVLQRDAQDPIWGWTEPGKEVTVSMNGKSVTATAGPDGKWMAKIGPFEAGGPYELTIWGPQKLRLTDVLVGDVWICSGQSNMEMGIGSVKDAQSEIAAADHPKLRLFTVPKHIAYEPQSQFRIDPAMNWQAKWLACTPSNVQAGGQWASFSATAYFFGRDLQQKLSIPIGLIHTSWGGTVAEAWTSAEALEQMHDFREQIDALRTHASGKDQLTFSEQMERWYAKHDPGSKHALGWAEPDLDDSDWKTMKLPQQWEKAGVGLDNFDGIVWFRREVSVPEAWNGKDLMLHLGPIDDRDTTWVNGTKVGGLDVYNAPRDYKVPAASVSGGKLLIAVRVLDTGGFGGIWGAPEQMKLEPASGGSDAIPLAGEWKYKVGVPLSESGRPPAPMANNPNVPTVLYNGMIGPLVPTAIRGAIWYQGESNADRAAQYRRLLPTMIGDWRGRFTSTSSAPGFPFFIVQLASFTDPSPQPQESQWAELREAQDLTARTVGNSAIAVATDIGDAHDIHPKNKQEVGRRLALDALAITYGKPIEYSGPVFTHMQVQDNKAILHFDHLGGGLEARGDQPLKGFAIAGPDKKFVWADARIEGDTVVVWSAQVEHPVAVRYAWANNPDTANLCNKAGLPAPPFRTDGPH